MNAPATFPALSPALFERVVLCATPVFDRTRALVGLRAFARGPASGAYPLSELANSLAPLLQDLAPLSVLLGASGASLDARLRQLTLPAHVTLEFDATLATHPAAVPLLRDLKARGVRLALRGRPPQRLTDEVLPWFDCAIVAQDDDRRIARDAVRYAEQRRLPFYAVGMRNLAETRAAFERGAAASIGWPVEDRLQQAPRNAQPAHLAVLELIRLLRENASPPQIEAVLKHDTTLAFRLLDLVNSPAMGLAQPLTSFQQALILLGYQRLQRWLIVMLASGSRDPEVTPLMVHSIGRGFLLDHLAQETGAEPRNDHFLTGAFSLLDRVTGTPFDALFRTALLTDDMKRAIVDGRGPLFPYLQLARATERADHEQVRRRLAALGVAPQAYNRAVLQAAVASRSLTASL